MFLTLTKLNANKSFSKIIVNTDFVVSGCPQEVVVDKEKVVGTALKLSPFWFKVVSNTGIVVTEKFDEVFAVARETVGGFVKLGDEMLNLKKIVYVVEGPRGCEFFIDTGNNGDMKVVSMPFELVGFMLEPAVQSVPLPMAAPPTPTPVELLEVEVKADPVSIEDFVKNTQNALKVFDDADATDRMVKTLKSEPSPEVKEFYAKLAAKLDAPVELTPEAKDVQEVPTKPPVVDTKKNKKK